MPKSKIEWTQHTWNPVTGCSKISEGCQNCYAESMAKRFGGEDAFKVALHPEKLEIPLKRKKPTTYFVWSYLFMQNNSITDMTFLWDLYSDASGKESSECSFVGAGGKEIDEGKIGCGVSRFGCWQCFIVRGEDKALGGLLKSGYKNIDLYVEYRNWFWNLTQKGWHYIRDVYRHDTFGRKMYLRGGYKTPSLA